MAAKDHGNKTIDLRIFLLIDFLIVLYVALVAIAQLLPPHYSPISQTESLLAVGPYGYIMTINFVNRGVFSLLFVYAFGKILPELGAISRRFRLGLYAIGIWGVGALLFTAFPATGKTLAIHTVIGIIAFIAAPLGELSISLQLKSVKLPEPTKKLALAISVIGVLFMVFYWGVRPFFRHFSNSYSGLFERFLIGSIILWIAIVSYEIYSYLRTVKATERLSGADQRLQDAEK